MPILIQEMLKKGFIEKEKATAFEYEIKQGGQREEEFLLEKEVIKEDILFKLKSELLNIPLKEISADQVPLETLEIIPEETARFYKMIPILKDGKSLQVGMVYPEDLPAQEALKFLARQAKFTFQVFLISLTVFNNLLRQYRTLKREVGIALEELREEIKVEAVPKTAAEFEQLAEEAPITKIVAVILKHAVEGSASDIHIEPTKDKMRVRFRLLGTLHSTILLPMKVHQAIVARIKILSNLKIDETRVPQDGRFSTKISDKDIDFRVSTFPTTLGEKAAIRVLDPVVGMTTFEKLGLEKRNLEVVRKAIAKPYGLILSTGPTGSGKTTTLYAILQLLNKEGVNIVTLEDPVEYFVEGVNQSQMRPEIGYDFAQGLRYVLRQDPNVIMVGEVRDEETASLVTHAALTGHIVLSTLHTSNAAGVIPRMVDLGVKPYLIPPTLSVAIAQRLVRKLCSECKEKIKPPKEIEEMILKEIRSLPLAIKKEIKVSEPLEIFRARGCKNCSSEGYTGRIGLFEVLSMTERLERMILKSPGEMEVAREAKKQEMATMRQDGIIKVLNGITTIEEVMRVTEETIEI
ncbi:MAG: GspE/PulE family protein [bacterium]